MKMNKKLIAGVMLAVMSAAVFTGCGGEGDSGSCLLASWYALGH